MPHRIFWRRSIFDMDNYRRSQCSSIQNKRWSSLVGHLWFGCGALTSLCQNNATNRVLGVNVVGDDAHFEKKVRVRITMLSAGYIFWCSILIWLTGGPFSPFTLFYVMIFSLTLGKIRVEKSSWPVLAFFVICILFACTSFAPDDWVVGQAALSDMQDSRSHYIIISMFLAASIGVPYYSALAVEKRKRELDKKQKTAKKEEEK